MHFNPQYLPADCLNETRKYLSLPTEVRLNLTCRYLKTYNIITFSNAIADSRNPLKSEDILKMIKQYPDLQKTQTTLSFFGPNVRPDGVNVVTDFVNNNFSKIKELFYKFEYSQKNIISHLYLDIKGLETFKIDGSQGVLLNNLPNSLKHLSWEGGSFKILEYSLQAINKMESLQLKSLIVTLNYDPTENILVRRKLDFDNPMVAQSRDQSIDSTISQIMTRIISKIPSSLPSYHITIKYSVRENGTDVLKQLERLYPVPPET